MRVILCSSAILKKNNKQILLMSRKKKETYKNAWEFPGGKLKNGESFKDAIIREIKEELNITVKLKNLTKFQYFSHQYRSFLLMMYVFELSKWAGKIISNEGEHIKWVSAKEIKNIKLLPANIKVISHFLK